MGVEVISQKKDLTQRGEHRGRGEFEPEEWDDTCM
jgi:hypothetical protein